MQKWATYPMNRPDSWLLNTPSSISCSSACIHRTSVYVSMTVYNISTAEVTKNKLHLSPNICLPIQAMSAIFCATRNLRKYRLLCRYLHSSQRIKQLVQATTPVSEAWKTAWLGCEAEVLNWIYVAFKMVPYRPATTFTACSHLHEFRISSVIISVK